MARKLFCELSPAAYQLSRQKNILLRKLRDLPLHGRLLRTNHARVCYDTAGLDLTPSTFPAPHSHP